MIKGIYNENEFYTNFYWDTKLLEDMRSKAPAGAEEKVNQLKALDSLFWKLKESTGSSGANKGQQIEFYNLLFRILGFQPVQEPTQTSENGHYTRFLNENKESNPELIGILTSEIETGSFEAAPLYLTDEIEGEESIFELDLKELLREELLDSQAPPRWVLVGSPNSLFIIERTKWALGRYIRIEWQEVFLQRDSKPYELLLGLCSKSALCPDSGSSSHDEFDDNSHRHAFEVTTELRESVREAIEALINELIDLRKESHQKIYAKESSDIYAKELTHDALYYVYRLLFLLYLEAQGEDSDLLPLKSEIYRNGYSLEKLLELDFVEVAPDSPEAKGTFIYESLEQIFNLIFYGFEPGVKDGLLKSDFSATGFLVKGIKSDLFDPNGMKHLRGVKLSNGVLLDILKKLSLTRKKERGNNPRARVSYANLGINQLGAVYEGLLSYTGFFAQEELHALKPAKVKQADIDKGKELDQIYLAPKSLVDKYRKTQNLKYKLTDENIVLDLERNPKIFKRGSFIYRLAGRDRQKLASYYTPESLTKFTVKYSLNVLFETKRTAEELWGIKILEPAMGSGAFLNEAVNQLADRILELEVDQGQKDLNSPKSKKRRLGEIKYQLVANNVYGVDLNPTAVELARFSLWLNVVGSGKEPPSFEGKLKVGNSLIGARNRLNAEGFFSWLVVDEAALKVVNRIKDFEVDLSNSLANFKKEFSKSIEDVPRSRLGEIQRLAEKSMSVLRDPKLKSEDRKLAYDALKFCCDIWCSFFFLDSADLKVFPKKYSELLDLYESILTFTAEIDKNLISRVKLISERERFFHWDLEFPFESVSGFDLILGNPPWVAIEWEDALYASDFTALPILKGLKAEETRDLVAESLSDSQKSEMTRQFIRTLGYSQFLESWNYRIQTGVTKNTYKSFVLISMLLAADSAAIGLIHEDGILKEKRANKLRELLYPRYRYHFHFINKELLFAEVDPKRHFSVNIYNGSSADKVSFIHSDNLLLPSDIGVRLEKEKERVLTIDSNSLGLFSDFSDDSGDLSPPFLGVSSSRVLSVLEKLRSMPSAVDFLEGSPWEKSQLLNSVTHLNQEIIEKRFGNVDSWNELIYERIHFSTLDPCYKEYNSENEAVLIDKENWHRAAIPRSQFKLLKPQSLVQSIFPKVGNFSYNQCYKIACKRQMQFSDTRCVFVTILPKDTWHLNSIVSLALIDQKRLPVIAGYLTSLLFEGIARLKSREDIYPDDLISVKIGDTRFHNSIARRVLALSTYPTIFEELINSNSEIFMDSEDDVVTPSPTFDLASGQIVAKNDDREMVLMEIDALVAASYGVSHQEFQALYLETFPALVAQDRRRNKDRIFTMNNLIKHFQERGW